MPLAGISTDIDAGAILAILGGVGALIYLLRFLKAQGVAAQLAAKDSVISTYAQAAAANEERIAVLEQQVASAMAEIKTLRRHLEAVEKYAAPEAVKRFERQQEIQTRILEAIQREVTSE